MNKWIIESCSFFMNHPEMINLLYVYRCPEQVMLCVLPKVSDSDTMINIQHKLIEAHCWENAVNLVKVSERQTFLLNHILITSLFISSIKLCDLRSGKSSLPLLIFWKDMKLQSCGFWLSDLLRVKFAQSVKIICKKNMRLDDISGSWSSHVTIFCLVCRFETRVI